MIILRKVALFCILFFSFLNFSNASTSSAHEYVLMDMKSGRVLKGKNYNSPVLIASITKIMSCLLAVESKKLDETVMVSDIIKKSYGSGIYIEVGEEITLRDLLYGLMLRSGNDAALMVAEYVGKDVDNFVSMMNKKAKSIGMLHTTFVNPSGLDNTDSGNYSTAYDMALLTRYAMQYEDYRKIVSTKKHIVKTNKKTYVWHNKNKLLNEKYVTGGKTGYTKKAKRTLVSTASYQKKDMIVVTLNDSDDWNTHKELYQYAFENYTSYLILKKSKFEVVGEKYYRNLGELYIKNDVYLPFLDKEAKNLVAKIVLTKKSRVKNNEKVGKYLIYLDQKLLYQEDIYLKKKVKKSSILKRGMF